MNLCSGFMNIHRCYTSIQSQAILPLTSSCYSSMSKNTSTPSLSIAPPVNIPSWNKLANNNPCVATIATRRFGAINSDNLHKPTLKRGDAKIAIVGGGICGVTAAHAIKTRLQTIAPNQKVEIVIYESDDQSYNGEESQAGFKSMVHPTWKAATARNANSLGKSICIKFTFVSFKNTPPNDQFEQ